jgi:hypothetical protein
MVAFRAKRLVCPAMSLISLTTSPIFCAAVASASILLLVSTASETAVLIIWDDWLTRLLMSSIEADNSSVAEATDWTFSFVS